jgi:hypothetical protein
MSLITHVEARFTLSVELPCHYVNLISGFPESPTRMAAQRSAHTLTGLKLMKDFSFFRGSFVIILAISLSLGRT